MGILKKVYIVFFGGGSFGELFFCLVLYMLILVI